MVPRRSSVGVRVLSINALTGYDRTLTGTRGQSSTTRRPHVTSSRYEPSVDRNLSTEPITSARRIIDAERRVHRTLRSRFAEELLELGVSFAQLEVMELLHGVDKLHPGEIGRRLLITRQSAAHLVHQLERGGLADTWPLEGGQVGVRLTPDGRRRARLCHWALGPTFDCLEALEPDLRTRLVDDLETCEHLLRPRPRPWWLEPF